MPSTGDHLWSEQYERDLKDVFVIQDDVTMRVLDPSLRVSLTEEKRAHIRTKHEKPGGPSEDIAGIRVEVIWNKESQMEPSTDRRAMALDRGYAWPYSQPGCGALE